MAAMPSTAGINQRPAAAQAFSRRRTMTAISTSEPARAINRAMVMDSPANAADSAPQSADLQLVFVYGTLKRGLANHRQLAAARFEGTATVAGLHLYDLGPFPMAIAAAADPAASLDGEIYGLSPDQLVALDRFEGAPRLYERQQHQLSDGRLVWVYVGRPQQVRYVRRISCWPPASAPPGPTPEQEPRH